MKRHYSIAMLLVLSLFCIAMIGCSKEPQGGNAADASSANPANAKIPNTTSSEEARKAFLQGRDLAERLLIQDSLQHFDRAISLDPNFALAHLNRANASPTAKEFFEHLNHAVAHAVEASEGERLLILGTEAGANGNPTKQKELLEKLVATYPNDERARFNLGGYFFGQQDFDSAILHYRKATEIAPTYSPAYNILGYALRQKENYAEAEKAFRKYIELIPNDPNPYDSLAELYLKMGKFDDAIAQYNKALSIDSNFINSHLGIGAALMYQGKSTEAATEFAKITTKARSDGERRTALFALTVLAADSGKWDQALAEVDKQYALGEKTNDVPNLAGDDQLRGNILLEMGKYDDAAKAFEKALKLTAESNLSQEIKDNAQLVNNYNLARVALGKKDLATAKAKAEEYRKGADAKKNSFQIKQAHELAGMIAIEEKNYDLAVAELQQANLQNPVDLYRLCQAHRGKGDTVKATEFCGKAANFNSLPAINYAFVRSKAKA